MGPGPDALRVAIDRAWQVFDLPAPATIGVCTCPLCMDPASAAEFLRRPPRDLSLTLVQAWYCGAVGDDLSHDQVAWFLPRVMELLADGEEVSVVGNEVALTRLRKAGFPDRWPGLEVEAINDFCLTLFRAYTLGDLPKGSGPSRDSLRLDDLLCMFSEGGLPVEPYLAVLESMPDADLVALLHRNWVFTRADGHRACVVWTTSFWDDLAAREAVQTFYTGPVVMAALDRELDRGNAQAAEILGT